MALIRYIFDDVHISPYPGVSNMHFYITFYYTQYRNSSIAEGCYDWDVTLLQEVRGEDLGEEGLVHDGKVGT